MIVTMDSFGHDNSEKLISWQLIIKAQIEMTTKAHFPLLVTVRKYNCIKIFFIEGNKLTILKLISIRVLLLMLFSNVYS